MGVRESNGGGAQVRLKVAGLMVRENHTSAHLLHIRLKQGVQEVCRNVNYWEEEIGLSRRLLKLQISKTTVPLPLP